MESRNIFITGIGGCVGHYLYDLLSADSRNRLFLLVRNPGKLHFSCEENSRIRIIHDHLENIHLHAELLKEMDAVVHLAASWGSRHADAVNVTQTMRLFSLPNPQRCRTVIYFSTASILGEDGRPTPAAEKYGTPYIRSKYRCYRQLPRLDLFGRIVTLFPTVILGGDRTHPYSHASRELKKIWKYLGWLKYFRIDGSFHFIHAHDIALVAGHLLSRRIDEASLVLGNPYLTVDECLDELCRLGGRRRRFSIDATPFLVGGLPRLLKKRLSPWDLYSLRRRHFRYETVSPARFGLQPAFDTLGKCIADGTNFFTKKN